MLRVTAIEPSWVAGAAPQAGCAYTAKPRYRTPDTPCVLEAVDDDSARLRFNEPQWALTPGQSVVVYDDKVCLGGGVIA